MLFQKVPSAKDQNNTLDHFPDRSLSFKRKNHLSRIYQNVGQVIFYKFCILCHAKLFCLSDLCSL